MNHSKKPNKPYVDFPLTAHAGSNQWCKRINGKLHYFGAFSAGWQAALDKYLQQRDELRSGRRPASEAKTVGDLLNAFLSNRNEALQLGELGQEATTKSSGFAT